MMRKERQTKGKAARLKVRIQQVQESREEEHRKREGNEKSVVTERVALSDIVTRGCCVPPHNGFYSRGSLCATRGLQNCSS